MHLQKEVGSLRAYEPGIRARSSVRRGIRGRMASWRALRLIELTLSRALAGTWQGVGTTAWSKYWTVCQCQPMQSVAVGMMERVDEAVDGDDGFRSQVDLSHSSICVEVRCWCYSSIRLS